MKTNDTYEISPCRVVPAFPRNGNEVERCDPEYAEFWTLYRRLPDGRVMAVCDLLTLEDAECLLAELDNVPQVQSTEDDKPAPGPWRVSKSWTASPAGKRLMIVHGDGETVSPIIAEVLSDYGRLPQKRNAALIAAAPTMHGSIIRAASRVSHIMDGFEPATPVWRSLQKVLFGLYDSLPIASTTGEAA